MRLRSGITALVLAFATALHFPAAARAQRQMERLRRGGNNGGMGTATEPILHAYKLDGTPGNRVAWQNVGYNQPPHTSFFVGEGMRRPPRPNISTASAKR